MTNSEELQYVSACAYCHLVIPYRATLRERWNISCETWGKLWSLLTDRWPLAETNTILGRIGLHSTWVTPGDAFAVDDLIRRIQVNLPLVFIRAWIVNSCSYIDTSCRTQLQYFSWHKFWYEVLFVENSVPEGCLKESPWRWYFGTPAESLVNRAKQSPCLDDDMIAVIPWSFRRTWHDRVRSGWPSENYSPEIRVSQGIHHDVAAFTSRIHRRLSLTRSLSLLWPSFLSAPSSAFSIHRRYDKPDHSIVLSIYLSESKVRNF